MKPGVMLRGGGDDRSLEAQMERQMGGCMAGFLQIFDRHQLLAGRRGFYSAKRLPSSSASSALSCTSPSERSDSSLSSSPKEAPSPVLPQVKEAQAEMRQPEPESLRWGEAPTRPSLPLPAFDLKEGQRSAWKFREAPRLSLDSRVDGRGKLFPREIRAPPPPAHPEGNVGFDGQDKQRRSPSVVARLMGLEAFPGKGVAVGSVGDGEQYKRGAELRRSASESRVSRDLLHCQFVDSRSFQLSSPQADVISGDKKREVRPSIVRDAKLEPLPRVLPVLPASPHPQTASFVLQRKSFFDVQDYFVSEPPKRVGGGSLYGEVEKRLRMRGIDEPAKDLETLKQILEVIQLRGLLHTSQRQRSDGLEVPPLPSGRNFVYEQSPTRTNCLDSPIVVMQPASRSPSPRSPSSSSYSRPNASPPPTRRNQFASPEPSRFQRRQNVESGRVPQRVSNEIRGRNAGLSDPNRTANPVSPSRRRPSPLPQAASSRGRLVQDRKASSQPPKPGNQRKIASDATTHSLRNHNGHTGRESVPHRPEDFADSDGSFSVSSQFDFERVKSEYRDGRILLERCDKLLNSIAEITSKAAIDIEHVNATEQQPSPVSVLDAAASFDREDAAPASPSALLRKRSNDFNQQSTESVDDDGWILTTKTVKLEDVSDIDDSDFLYVSEILSSFDSQQMAVHSFRSEKSEDDDIAGDPNAQALHRRLISDAVTEIVERHSHVSPWESFMHSRSLSPLAKPRLRPGEVLGELRRLQDHAPADDLCGLICRILRKDMAASVVERTWAGRPAEMSSAVLDIERLIFKDLVAETILHLSTFFSERRRCKAATPKPPTPLPRRRLMF